MCLSLYIKTSNINTYFRKKEKTSETKNMKVPITVNFMNISQPILHTTQFSESWLSGHGGLAAESGSVA